MLFRSGGDIVEVRGSSDESARLIWNTWSQDPIKAAVLQAILLCLSNVFYYSVYGIFSVALGQYRVCPLYYSLLKGEEVYYPNIFRIATKFMISSLPWTDILAPGGQLLAISMFNRKTVPGYANQTSCTFRCFM